MPGERSLNIAERGPIGNYSEMRAQQEAVRPRWRSSDGYPGSNTGGGMGNIGNIKNRVDGHTLGAEASGLSPQGENSRRIQKRRPTGINKAGKSRLKLSTGSSVFFLKSGLNIPPSRGKRNEWGIAVEGRPFSQQDGV